VWPLWHRRFGKCWVAWCSARTAINQHQEYKKRFSQLSHLAARAQGTSDWKPVHGLSCALDPPAHAPLAGADWECWVAHAVALGAVGTARTLQLGLLWISCRALVQGEGTEEGRQHADEQHGRTWHQEATMRALLLSAQTQPIKCAACAVLLCVCCSLSRPHNRHLRRP
jgi:hypothetical protein